MQLSGRLAALGFRQHAVDLWVNGGWALREVVWREYKKQIDADGKTWVKYGEPKLRRHVWRLANGSAIVHSEDTLSAMVDWLEKMAWVGGGKKGGETTSDKRRKSDKSTK